MKPSATLNGQRLAQSFLQRQDVAKGGSISTRAPLQKEYPLLLILEVGVWLLWPGPSKQLKQPGSF
jgi:hypothetical protein